MKKFLALLVVLGLVAVYVWPTRYKNYAAGEGPYASEVKIPAATRVDRLTGDIELQETSGEWVQVGNVRKAMAFDRPDVNPNAIHESTRPYDRTTANQQQQSFEKTQKDIQSATK